MMGILDNIDQFFLAQTTMGKNAREDQLAQEGRLRQQQQQAQIEALLNTAGQAPATSSMDRAQMLTGGGQLPQAPGLDPVTMARIGNVMQNPAVMGAAGQMQTQQNAQTTLSPYQALMAKNEQERLAQSKQQWESMSPYQKAQIGIQQQELNMRQAAASPDGKLYQQLGPGTKMFDEHLKEFQSNTSALTALDKMQSSWNAAGMMPNQLGRAEMAKAEPYQQEVLAWLSSGSNTGVMNATERANYLETLKRPDLFSNSANTQKALAGIRERMMRATNNLHERNPYIQQLAPPPPTGFK